MCCLFVFFNDITRLLPKYYNSAGAPRLDILTVFRCPGYKLTSFWYTVARPSDVIIFAGFVCLS